MVKSTGLGKGFGSLLPDDFDKSILADKKDRVQMVGISQISADPSQPRKHFDHESITGLAESIKKHGILQPIVLTPGEDAETYIIIAGERRFRAAKIAKQKSVPALVRSTEELEKLEISLIENVQRVDLRPLEQAESIVRLHEQFGLSYQQIAERLGKAHTTVVNMARLLQLPDEAKKSLEQSEISEGHARAILALKGQSVEQKQLLELIRSKSISVREAERFVKTSKEGSDGKKPKAVLAQEDSALSGYLDAKVRIKNTSSGKGMIEIRFLSGQDLKRIKNRIQKSS